MHGFLRCAILAENEAPAQTGAQFHIYREPQNLVQKLDQIAYVSESNRQVWRPTAKKIVPEAHVSS